MSKLFIYIILIFTYLMYSKISFSQEVGLKEIIKKQQDKIQLIEGNLKSLIGRIENKEISKSFSDQLSKIETDLSKITNQFKNLSEFAYELEFKINRIEKNLKLSPTLNSKNNDINSNISLQDNIKQNTEIKTQGLDSKTPGVLGFIKTDKKISDDVSENKSKSERI